ncbi:hypothetical protein WKI13_18835 [Teredinibacter turnerae]|uniref:hypothetical protein n=1 Tax=Teredinibacter turnerae TaxID=2426 RepID=UPI00036E9434|nr:hypothetical protein [Teredinibacter turnerae]
MINSVMSEGLKGMQHSQREMQKSAQEIAEANIREQPSETVDVQSVTRTNPVAPVEEAVRSDSGGDIVEPLIELRRQEQLFDASANVVSVADKTLGSLIDVKS